MLDDDYPLSLEQLFHSLSQWSQDTEPKGCCHITEYADRLILLLHAVRRDGYTCGDLMKAATDTHMANKLRQWEALYVT
jgi:hypothetical protein